MPTFSPAATQGFGLAWAKQGATATARCSARSLGCQLAAAYRGPDASTRQSLPCHRRISGVEYTMNGVDLGVWDLEGHLRTRPQPRAHLAAGATLPRPTSSAQHCAPLAVHICQCTPGCPPRAHANDNGHGRHKHASMPVAAMQGGRTATRYNAAARRSSTMPGCIRQMRCGVNVCGRAMRGVWQAQLRHEGMSRTPRVAKGTRPLSNPKAPLRATTQLAHLASGAVGRGSS